MTSRLSKHDTYGGGHAYKLDGKQRVPSVSGIKSTLHTFTGSHADKWRVQQVADAVDAHWETLDRLSPETRRSAIVSEGVERLNTAADFGKAVHKYAEQLWTGEPVDVPEQYAGHVTAIAKWWELHELKALAVEAMAWSDNDELKGGAVAGTLDLLVSHPRYGPGILDFKTWRAQSSGTPRPQEWAFQLVAYADMDYICAQRGGELVDEIFPRTQWWGVLHVGPGGARLWTVTRDGYWHALAQVHAARHLKSLASPKMLETEW